MGQLEVLNRPAGGFSNDVQLTFKRVLHDHVIATANEDLPQDGLFFAHGRRHWHVSVDRHVAPAQKHLTFKPDGALHGLLASQAGRVFFGQKHHANAVFARRRQLDALQGHFFAVQRIRQLNQNTSTVAHQLVCADCAPVVEVFEDLQTLLHDGVALMAFNMRHKAHTASVVLVVA